MGRGRKQAALVLLPVTAGCLAMAWIEGSLRPVYPVKSALKIAVFLGCSGLYMLLTRDWTPWKSFRRPSCQALRLAALLALGTLAVLLGGYLLLSPWLDLSAIPANLAAKEGITRQTFSLAAIYITFCNSLLEEYFFRGFAFLSLHQMGYKKLAYGFSALAFALYHLSIAGSWGAPVLVLLMVAGLTAAGLLFSWLDRQGSILPAWLVHMGANLATNTVGLMLFGILPYSR